MNHIMISGDQKRAKIGRIKFKLLEYYKCVNSDNSATLAQLRYIQDMCNGCPFTIDDIECELNSHIFASAIAGNKKNTMMWIDLLNTRPQDIKAVVLELLDESKVSYDEEGAIKKILATLDSISSEYPPFVAPPKPIRKKARKNKTQSK